MRRFGLIITLSVFAVPLSAQSHDHSPYAGMEARTVLALSAEELAGLEAGDGLGFALAAELNGVPGPKHVLELSEALELTPAQRSAVEELQAEMVTQAVGLGRRIVEAETHLDRLFAQGHATRELVLERSLEIGSLRGALRAVHLNAHTATAEVLSDEQVARYARLRGYGAG